MENNIVLFSMYAGFMMIVIAPVFKLFSKAGVKGYLSLVPGLNLHKANSFLRKKISYLSGITIVALLAFVYMIEVSIVQEDIGQAVFMHILFVFVIYSLCAFYIFPLLSTTVFFYIAYLGSLYGQFNQLYLILAVILFIIGIGQGIIDFLNWKTLLSGLGKKPFWIIVPFIPTAVVFILSAITLGSSLSIVSLSAEELASMPIGLIYDIKIMLLLFAPALFIATIFVYYLGYSIKTSFSLDQK